MQVGSDTMIHAIALGLVYFRGASPNIAVPFVFLRFSYFFLFYAAAVLCCRVSSSLLIVVCGRSPTL